MARAIITLKIMPESLDVDLDALAIQAQEKVATFAGQNDMKVEQEPIAFGLKALKITFVMDESRGGTDALEETLKTLDGVQGVEVTDVRRALG